MIQGAAELLRRAVHTPLALDFWFLDLVTKKTRPLTHFANQGAIRTFDITPDGKSIVFDRIRQNADVVMADLNR